MKPTLLSALFLIIYFTACKSPSSSERDEAATATSSTTSVAASVVTLTVQEFAAQNSRGTLLDVRTAGEVAAGKIEGALAIDYYSSNFLDQISQFPKDRELYLYCAVGGRSEEAARLLLQQGYTKVYHLKGGIQGWSQEGMAVVR